MPNLPSNSDLRALITRSPAQLRLRDLVLSVGRGNYTVVREDLARRYLWGEGVEVGALDRPLRVPPGVTVRYMDYRDKPGLIAEVGDELRAVSIDPETMVVVDHVDVIDSMATFADASVDFIVALHVLEHIEDPLGALANVLRVLRPGGVAMLALPDPRFSFDQRRERTSVEHLLRDHRDGPEGSRAGHYEEWARIIESRPESEIADRVAEYARIEARHHFHVWELESFLDFLRASGLHYELLHAQAYAEEFTVILSKPGA